MFSLNRKTSVENTRICVVTKNEIGFASQVLHKHIFEKVQSRPCSCIRVH